jgi:hypothetical protein
MPGVGTCGRCGSTVALQTLDVDIHPPRASERAKRWRRWLPFRFAYYSARNANQRVQESWFHHVWQIESPNLPLGTIGRMIVPGWPQFHMGQPIRGRTFLLAWIAFVVLAMLFYGVTLGSVFLGLAFSVHVSSCLSILHRGGIDSRGFWVNVVLVFFGLLVCVYLPAGWMVSRTVRPAVMEADSAIFASGDVLLCSPAAFWLRAPRPGDVVVYQQSAVNYTLPPPQHTAVRIAEGQRIDRILAGPGDTIIWKDGQLTVNGQPSELLPLNPDGLRPVNANTVVPTLMFTLPAGCYLILPSVGPHIPGTLNARGWRELSVIQADAIVGRVLLRSYPFTRIGRIN